jgi:protein-disulfide isomerase
MVPRVPLSTSARCAFAAAWLALLGVAGPVPADSPGAGAAASEASKPVAEVDGKPITMGELEKSVSGQLAKLDHQRRAVLERGLGSLIDQKILEAEAASRGMTVEALEKAEIDDKAGQVSDADAEAFYKANKARLPPNRPEKQLLPQIKTYLVNQKKEQLRDNLLSALRAKYHPNVLLEPERVHVSDAGAPAKGPKNAPVTIIEFSDFQCPFCARVEPALKEMFKTFGNEVRLVYRQFPLGFHANAEKAAEASLCANDQGKFWEMHDAMFADQHALGVDKLKATAARLGLNASQFDKCLDGGKYKAQVRKDVAAGMAAGVQGTPTLFINGRVISGAVPFGEIKRVIDDELARKQSAG